MIYLDNASTTQISLEVADKIYEAMKFFGNPSNIYKIGKESKEMLRNAQEQVANVIGAESEEIYFTSGATESNNLAINQREYCICSPYEHHSVLKIPKVSDKNDISSFTKLVRNEFQFLSYVPIVFLSALTKKRIHTLMPEVVRVYENSKREIKTSILNDVIRDAVLLNQPPSYKGKRLKIYFVNQSGIQPPKFTFNVNSKGLVHFSYERYLENKIRENFNFEGTPIVIQFKNKNENI